MIIFDSFTYVGPNRRSDLPVQELSLALTQTEIENFKRNFPELPSTVNQLFTIFLPDRLVQLTFEDEPAPDSLQALAVMFCGLALLIQQQAGHKVNASGLAHDNKLADIQLFFEYDDVSVAVSVTEFCVKIFNELLADPELIGIESLGERLRPELLALLEDAIPRATPADTRAIIDAASLRGIPWIRMEKTSYNYHDGDFRLRKNTLINLGHGCKRKIIDSTFCVDNSLACFDLIRNREEMTKALTVLGVPIPHQDIDLGPRSSLSRVARAAEKIGYPVALKTPRRKGAADTFIAIRNRGSLEKFATQIFNTKSDVLVERFVEGSLYRIIVANLKIQCILVKEDREVHKVWEQFYKEVHPENLTIIAKIANYFPVGIMEIHIACQDLTFPIVRNNGAVVDVKLAPVLDDLASSYPKVLQSLAVAFVDWMYPDSEASRIPIVAVTGTNGKTSTCRMIDSVFRKAGYRTGLACTDGIYVNCERVNQGDFAGFPGHLTVLNASIVEAAILESSRGGVMQNGLGFDKSNVSVCLNVTEDHLGEYGINTLEDMTRLKLSILSRASKAVVLNADDPQCVLMKPKLSEKKICLVSSGQSLELLREVNPDISCFVFVSRHEEESWITIFDCDIVIPVMNLAEIPATWNGAARQYVSNALHAIAACYLSNLSIENIRNALAEFRLSYDIAPGRLNIHQGGGVTVIMDFAKNPASLRELIKCVDIFPRTGKRIIGLSCSAKNSDAVIRETAKQAAGKFDHYVCKNFKLSNVRPVGAVPSLLREALIASGVESSAIEVVDDSMAAVKSIIDMAKPGDVLVLMTGNVHREETWKYITDHLV